MERLILALVAGVLVSCTPGPQPPFDAKFARAVTALLISRYDEDPASHRFTRTTAWGEVPEKLVPDGRGGYTVAVPVLIQGESSDGPLPDQFQTVLVHVVQAGSSFTLSPNDQLPGPVQSWHDPARRTVWFRGDSWQFQGRY